MVGSMVSAKDTTKTMMTGFTVEGTLYSNLDELNKEERELFDCFWVQVSKQSCQQLHWTVNQKTKKRYPRLTLSGMTFKFGLRKDAKVAIDKNSRKIHCIKTEATTSCEAQEKKLSSPL